MKKAFSFVSERHKPARMADQIKSEIRKYLKRERSKPLPEGQDFWDFDCKAGPSAESATACHEKEIGAAIDRALEAGEKQIYLEILAKPRLRQARKKSE